MEFSTSQVDEEFSNNDELYNGVYKGPAYEFTSSVTNFKRLPRFGHGSDFTAIFSSYQEDQTDYAAGLIALFLFLLIAFVFWTIMIIVFKFMGPGNAGFLSGYHFVVPDPVDDEKNLYKRPRRVRIVFLIATALLMLFAFLLVALGFTNVNNAAVTMGESLQTTEDILSNAEEISINLEKVGDNSIAIRDAAVQQLDNLCPADPNIAETIGMDIMGIAQQAKTDLTMLADFIKEGLVVLDETLVTARGALVSANNVNDTIQFWDWQMKLLAAGLFILPSFLAVGVGLVMLDIDIQKYQQALTYFFMPLFVITIIASYVVCCAILPISASSADACSGGGKVYGGVDDTVLTIYRNLRGDDNSIIFQFLAFYTQQCNPAYYPFGFLDTYFNDLNNALESTGNAAEAIGQNQALLSNQCGREFGSVLEIVESMDSNLKLLQKQVDASLDLVKCENINKLYVNTVHEAGCTYSVDALAWIFASALVISVCGLIMIMLRASYYPVEYLDMSDEWNLKQDPTRSASKDSAESTMSHSNPNSPEKPTRSANSRYSGSMVRVSSNRRDEFEFELPRELQKGEEF